MSYSTIEAAAAVLLRALSNFDDADVTRGDYRVLDQGSPPYVVLLPGPFECVEAGDWGQKVYTWTMYAEVFERYLNGGSSETALETTRQAVIDCLCKNPTMNAVTGVTRVLPRRGAELRYLYDEQGGGPHFVMQRIEVEIEEVVGYTGSGEFA